MIDPRQKEYDDFYTEAPTKWADDKRNRRSLSHGWVLCDGCSRATRNEQQAVVATTSGEALFAAAGMASEAALLVKFVSWVGLSLARTPIVLSNE